MKITIDVKDLHEAYHLSNALYRYAEYMKKECKALADRFYDLYEHVRTSTHMYEASKSK